LGFEVGVPAEKGVVGPCLVKASEELGVGVAEKPTNVRAGERQARQA